MKVAIVLLCLVVSSFAQPPSQHPVISETFTCTIRVESISKNEDDRMLFNGTVVRDFQAKRQVSELTVVSKGMPTDHEWDLERYDLNMTYYMSWEGDSPRGSCHAQQDTDGISSMWDWVKNAKYNDTEEYNHHKVDIYAYKVNTTEMSLGVLREDPNTPYIFREIFSNQYIVYNFDDFKPTVHDVHAFDVPQECQSSMLKKPQFHYRPKLFKLF